ncbi:hypothetical protein CUS89_09595 [Enterococcus mundtii]|uniref:DUF1430 domain-containing protein n=1 Tax=Enterococcus mundtii TaxID=53346 RepID=A0A2S7RTE5_ENTMU|nr:hypothetical protein CUS89_09595 [Enterococcus mundtii]
MYFTFRFSLKFGGTTLKKTMILFLSIITILISVAFALNKKSEEDKYYDDIELTSNSTHFFIKDSDISIDDQLSEFASLSKKYNATFIRSDILTENGKTYIYKSGIYSTNYFDQLGIKLASGKIPASNNEFLANYNTEDNNQSGRISNMFSDKKLIFGTLQDFYTKNKMSVNGSYTLISESKDSADILNQISTVFKIPKDELLKATYEQAYGQGTIYLLVLVLSIIIMAIFCLMSAFYPIAKLKEIGVMKLLGFKDIDIWIKLNKVILLIPALFYICTLPIQSFIIPDSNLSYFLELTLVELVVFVLAWVFSLVMLIIIRRYNLSDILKNFFNLKFSLYFSYLLKFFVFVAVVAVIPLLATELNTLHKDLKAKDLYEQQKHYLTLSKFNYVDDEFQESLQGKGKLDSKLINLYKELDTSADIQYVSVSNINATVFNGAKINTSKFKDIEFDDSDDYLIMSANENYMKRIQFKLPTPSSKIYSETEMTYLVPEYLKKDFEKTEFFIRIQLASLLSDNSFENIEDIPIRFIFYPNNENEIFSENIEMIGNNKTFIKNPIIFCINNNTINTSSMFLKNSPLSNPLRIENTKENKLAISEAIINNNLENNSIQFENILSTGFAQELLISQSSVGIWITILCLTISVSVLASYYIILIILASKRKEMIVSRLLGYTFYDRYRNEIFYFFSIYIFGLIEIVILNKQILSMLAYLLLVSIDIFIIFLMVTRYEKGTLSAGLKGDV